MAFLIGYIDDVSGPQPYYYQDEIVIVDKNYQCPKSCGVNHNHSVYYKSLTNGIVIEKNLLGEKYKVKKTRRKK